MSEVLHTPFPWARELSGRQALVDGWTAAANMASRGRRTGLCNCLLTAIASTNSNVVPVGGLPKHMLLVRLSSNSRLCT